MHDKEYKADIGDPDKPPVGDQKRKRICVMHLLIQALKLKNPRW